MILVSGTKRSGTSMWLKILQTAGLPAIAQAFPLDWGDRPLKRANPDGFYESSLRDGIWWMTNPDPKTGHYLHPQNTRNHVVKVFLPGLMRTDIAFIDRAIITMRSWRSYCVSVARLHALEQEGLGEAASPQPRYSHALEWWLENYIGLRDLLARRYSAYVTTYEAVCEKPGDLIPETLQWLGIDGLDIDQAVAVVSPPATPSEPNAPDDMPASVIEVFDALYHRVHHGLPFDDAFVNRLNTTHQELTPLLSEHLRQAQLHRQFDNDAKS